MILDCGTGAHDLGQALMTAEPQLVRGHILISHTHWDHIQGIPFFAPLFVPGNEWDIYAPRGLSQSLRDTLAGQMQYTYFPVTLEGLGATIRYHDLVEGVLELDDVKVRTQYLNHPALTLGYRLEVDGVSVVYACDHEPHSPHAAVSTGSLDEQDEHHMEFLRRADLVIHDAQYTATEYANKVGWGHSTIEYAIEVCRLAGARRLVFTHHDPLRDDESLDQVQESVRAKLRGLESELEVFAAAEGLEIDLEGELSASEPRPTQEFLADTQIDLALWKHSILLGVTNTADATLLSEAAQAENIRVRIAENAESTLQTFESEKPSLVILDEHLASNDGFEICRGIRDAREDYACSVPIIVIVDEAGTDIEISEVVTDKLVKPYSREYARTRIRAWVLRNTCRWIKAPLPQDEERRLAALKNLAVLDTQPEERFDRITRVAAAMFDVPIAVISLVDRDRQWFKSCYGMETRETPREMAFCAHAILKQDVMTVPDTFLDHRFADNPLVTDEPRIRFYAGCPLTMSDGSTIGTLCLIDTRPRQLGDKDISLLKDLGSLAQQELVATNRQTSRASS